MAEGCVKDDMKHKCSKIVLFISIGLFVIACALLGYASASYGGMEKIGAGEYQTPFKFESDSVAFAMCMVGGIFSLILAILGCATVKLKNPLVTGPFVICTFIVAIICMIGGGVVMSGDIRQQACFTKFTPKGGVETTGNDMAKEYLQFVDKSMCSSLCPCEATQEAAWKKNLTAEVLKKYDRTLGPSDSKPFKTEGAKVKMQFGPVSGSGGQKKEFKDFATCYTEVLAKKSTTDTSAKYQKAQKVFASEGQKFFKQIEETYQCAGLCEKGLFYVSKPISDGMPQKSCVQAFADKYGSNMGVAAVSFITAIVLIVAGIAAIPLCCGFSKRTEEDLQKG